MKMLCHVRASESLLICLQRVVRSGRDHALRAGAHTPKLRMGDLLLQCLQTSREFTVVCPPCGRRVRTPKTPRGAAGARRAMVISPRPGASAHPPRAPPPGPRSGVYFFERLRCPRSQETQVSRDTVPAKAVVGTALANFAF